MTFIRTVLMACALVFTGCRSTQHDGVPPPPPDTAHKSVAVAPVVASSVFEIDSDFGEEAAWMPAYLDACYAALVKIMDNPEIEPPDSIKVQIRKVDDHPGISGWAAVPSGEIPVFFVGFMSREWLENRAYRWIVAHELVNAFAHHYGGAGGYPSDFWANGRSPFPEYLSCIVMREAGYPEDGQWRRGVHAHKRDHALYWTLDEQYSVDLFARFFKLLRNDGVRIGDLGDTDSPWPEPDATRSLYTIAYLSIAAGRNLAPIFREAGVGKEPDDWKHGIRAGVRFREYEVRDADVAAIMAARERLFGDGASPEHGLEPQRRRFRRGLWQE